MKQDSILKFSHARIDMAGAKKTGMRTQFGALCYRMRDGAPEVLLVTSRRTKRWIIPKGWPMDGASPAQSAAREAYEEAGVEGHCYEASIGMYTYTKDIDGKRELPCAVVVFPLKVKTVLDVFPEHKQRKRKWFRLKGAAKRVSDPELAQLLRRFDPKSISKVTLVK